MALAGRVTATSGVLLRLREQLGFINRSCEILKMKRDHIAGEVNKLLQKIEARQEMEKKLMKVYEEIKLIFVEQGYSGALSFSFTVSEAKVNIRTVNIMGVNVVKICLEKLPNLDSIPSLLARETAEKFSKLLKEILSIAETEHQIEALAKELMIINRKVNALEKVVIPNFQQLINNVEEKLEEENLEEFFRAKLMKIKESRESI